MGKGKKVNYIDMVKSVEKFGELTGHFPFGHNKWNSWQEKCCNADTLLRSFGTWANVQRIAKVNYKDKINYTKKIVNSKCPEKIIWYND